VRRVLAPPAPEPAPGRAWGGARAADAVRAADAALAALGGAGGDPAAGLGAGWAAARDDGAERACAVVLVEGGTVQVAAIARAGGHERAAAMVAVRGEGVRFWPRAGDGAALQVAAPSRRAAGARLAR